MNPVGTTVASDASERAHALHASLRVADLHADSLLWGRDLLERGTRGAVDVPRLIEGNVVLQVLAMAVKTPRGLNIERNEDTSDQVLPLALAKRWPRATWGRNLPRVRYLAQQAHALEARSHGAFRLITSSPYDYRDSVSEWWRSLFILQPDVEAVQDANTVYQVHAIIAWAFWALFPFSRLVHAWSIPLQYLGRPYILYRRRYAASESSRPR